MRGRGPRHRGALFAPLRALLLFGALGAAAPAAAQDSHYWSIQYGPVGQLVGGQLIGGVDDLSSTFYNPGALALRNESSYLLSTESFQWEYLKSDSEPGLPVLDATSSSFGAAPSLLAGALPRWLGRDTHLAWSFLTRQKLDIRLGQRVSNPLPSPAVSSASEVYFDQDSSEMWGGLTLSRPLSEELGVGLTWYGVYRGQRLRNELSIQGIETGGSFQSALGVAEIEYSHYRTLAKLGVSWRKRTWKAGLTVTTPSLAVLGSGRAAYTLSVAGVDANLDGAKDAPTLVAVTEDDLESYYKSSWAVGFGGSRAFGNTNVYASAEWFAPVDRFAVLAPTRIPPDSSPLTQELRSVFNAGLGFERVMSDDVSVYGAFHTDFSASTADARADIAVSDWDLYHVSGGVSFRVSDNRFTLGVSWSTGSKKRPLDTSIPPESLPEAGLDSDIQIRYSKVTFLLGFVFGR